MKKNMFFCVLLSSFFLCAAPVQSDSWKTEQIDAKRAFRNDASSARKKMPDTLLAPCPKSEIGVIRRVALNSNERVCAITFDLCELATATTGCDMEILGFLHEKKIPATLFAGGKWMRTHAKRTRQLICDPLFEFGNHAWTHGNCALLTSKALRAQILWTQAQYEELRSQAIVQYHISPEQAAKIPLVPQFFRLPYGRCTEKALEEIAALGLQVVLWDVVGEQGSASSKSEAQKIAKNVVKQVHPGSILLFHANSVPKGSSRIVQEVVLQLLSQQYRFVFVSELLRMGNPVRVMDGYFVQPGDNKSLDRRFGCDGTGSKVPFTGE